MSSLPTSTWRSPNECLIDWPLGGGVVFAVPGHPRFGERSVALIETRCRELGIPVVVLDAVSFVDTVVSAVGADPLEPGLQVADAEHLAIRRRRRAVCRRPAWRRPNAADSNRPDLQQACWRLRLSSPWPASTQTNIRVCLVRGSTNGRPRTTLCNCHCTSWTGRIPTTSPASGFRRFTSRGVSFSGDAGTDRRSLAGAGRMSLGSRADASVDARRHHRGGVRDGRRDR